MDVREITTRIEPYLNDDQFIKELKSNPVKAIEKKIGFSIPQDQVKQVLEYVKKKVDIGDVDALIAKAQSGGFFSKLFKKH